MFSQKGDTVSVVLVAALILLTVVLLANNFYQTDTGKQEESKKVKNETFLATQKAITLAINNFAEAGYSNSSPVWYCNYPFPPELSETKSSLKTFIDEQTRLYLDALKKARGYTVRGNATATLDVDNISTFRSLPDSWVKVNISDLYVGVTSGKTTKELDAANSYEFSYRLWLLYKRLYEWVKEGAGGISYSVCSVLDKPCQARRCTCAQSTSDLIDSETIQSLAVSEEEIKAALDTSLNSLNARFSDSDISCSYEIDKIDIQNVPHKLRVNSQGCSCAEAETGFFEDTATERPTCLRSYINFALASTGCPASRGGLADIDSLSATEDEPFGYAPPTTYPGTATKNGTHELLGIGRKTAVHYTVTCEDSRYSIGTEEALKPFTTKIKLRFSLKSGCPLPPACMPNGACGPTG